MAERGAAADDTMRRFKMQNADGKVEVVEMRFDQPTLQVFEWYLRFLADLKATHVVSMNDCGSMSLKWSAEDQLLRENVVLPEGRHIESFLMQLRPFILQKEPTFLPSVTGLIVKSTTGKSIRRVAGNLNELFSGKSRREHVLGVRLLNKGEREIQLISNRTLTEWMNVFYFHKDAGRQDRFRKSLTVMSYEHAVFHMLSVLSDKTNAIQALGELIALITDRLADGVGVVLGRRHYGHIDAASLNDPPANGAQ